MPWERALLCFAPMKVMVFADSDPMEWEASELENRGKL
jgi:hypothetical protein